MIKKPKWRINNWNKYTDCFTSINSLIFEPKQAYGAGKDITVEKYENKIKDIIEMSQNDPEKYASGLAIYNEMQDLPQRNDYKYIEPSDWEDIQSTRTGFKNNFNTNNLVESKLIDKINGAWLGRIAGCLLGQPIETWEKDRIEGLLKDTNNYLPKYYISSIVSDRIREKYDISDNGEVYGSSHINWINNINHGPVDDDLNWTILNLKLVEKYGRNFTSKDVLENWLANIPIYHIYTGARIAYKNYINGISPPKSAEYFNTYKECIGAQIRGDLFGYINPGRPEIASQYAWRDASTSHIKNGIYSEMFVASILAAAAISNDIEEIIQIGLSQIPKKCRLSEMINMVLEWKKRGLTYKNVISNIHNLYSEDYFYHWLHSFPNIMIVCMSIIYGELDFERSVGLAVISAFDTDCNAATVGSIVGMLLGAKALPNKWISPLNDRVETSVGSIGIIKISELVKRSMQVQDINI